MASEPKTFWAQARDSRAGIVVTAFPTRDEQWRARVDLDGHGVYSQEYKTLAELFAALSESARGGP